MNALPKSTADAVRTTLNALLASLVPQDQIENATNAFLANVCGKSKTDREPDRLLSAREAATMLHRSTKTVRELAKRGKIRRIFCGANCERSSGYSQKSVEAFLSGKEAV